MNAVGRICATDTGVVPSGRRRIEVSKAGAPHRRPRDRCTCRGSQIILKRLSSGAGWIEEDVADVQQNDVVLLAATVFEQTQVGTLPVDAVGGGRIAEAGDPVLSIRAVPKPEKAVVGQYALDVNTTFFPGRFRLDDRSFCPNGPDWAVTAKPCLEATNRSSKRSWRLSPSSKVPTGAAFSGGPCRQEAVNPANRTIRPSAVVDLHELQADMVFMARNRCYTSKGLVINGLACISHHPTVEAHDTTARTSLRLLAVLDVLFKYACARQAARASS